jgi:hypothetical protein
MSIFFLNKDTMRGTILANLISFVSRLPDTKAWKVEITEHRKSRTQDQNEALFGHAYKILSAETGYTLDELHEAMCKRFFGTVEREIFGQVVSRPYRTTTTGPDGKRDVLPWDAFSDFYAMVEQVAAESGIFIPEPDPFWRERAREAA